MFKFFDEGDFLDSWVGSLMGMCLVSGRVAVVSLEGVVGYGGRLYYGFDICLKLKLIYFIYLFYFYIFTPLNCNLSPLTSH